LPILLPRRVVPGALATSALLLAAGVLVPLVLDDRTSARAEQLRRVFGFEAPNAIAVWWSSLLFLLVALLAYSRAVPASSAEAGAGARAWYVLAGLFTWTSMDHATHAHIGAARLLHDVVGVPESLDPLGLVLTGVAGVSGFVVLRSATRRASARLLLGGALLVVGGWGVDVGVALFASSPGTASRAAEAAAEWAGLTLLAVVFADERAWPAGGDSKEKR
jgi:hypothetical protein